MKNVYRLPRPIVFGVLAGAILVAVFWLNRPLQLPQTNPLQTPAGSPDGTAPALGSPTVDLPDVNADTFKDQGRLAFVRDGLLYVLDGETGTVAQLTESGRVLQPAWSHDGQWLAFIRVTDADANAGPLWVMRRDGTQAHQIQGLPEPVGRERFYWSPTDNLLAVSMQDSIWLVPAEGAPQELTQAKEVQSLAWSPDGKSLAYNVTLPSDKPEDRSDALYTIAIDGGDPVKHLTAPQAGIHVAAWWPDGKGFLYRLAPLHSASLAADGMDLWSLGIDDAEPRSLVSGLAYPEWLSFAPQGNLVTVAGEGRTAWSGKRLAGINPQSGSVQEFENPAGCIAIDPAFSPDGSRIAFVAAKDLGGNVWGGNPEELDAWEATRTLWIRNADSSGAHPLESAGAGVYQPVWSKDGQRILYVRDDALWIIGAEGGEPEKVVDLSPGQQDRFGFYGFVSYQHLAAWYQP